MKPISHLLLLLLLFTVVACRAETSSPNEEVGIPFIEADSTPVPTIPEEGSTREADEPVLDLPLLPSLRQAGDAYGLGEPLPGGGEDPFAKATFSLNAQLPEAPETAVVEQHLFSPLDEATARKLADQFGFTGPLYFQKTPPEFAPPPGEESAPVYMAFNGQSILNMGDTGLSYENRGIFMDYNLRPVYTVAVSKLETRLKEWELLNFPYEIRVTDNGDIIVSRLIDGVAVEQSEYNFAQNHDGEIAYFDFQPLRQVDLLGNYPLQSAERAWEQLQTSSGRVESRYQMVLPLDPADDPFTDFVNPRSWVPLSDPGQELHLYISPAVYEATDDSGLRIMHGDFTLTGDSKDLAEIAAHISDVLHVWGTTGLENGAKTLLVDDWEVVDLVRYETLEGTIEYTDDQALLKTADDGQFILAAAPPDIPEDIKVYVSVAARRDAGLELPVLDWMSISEIIDYPEVPVETSADEQDAIQTVAIDSASLIYFSLYQTAESPWLDTSFLLLPVWKFSGETDQGHQVIFWVPAVEPQYLQTPPQINSTGTGSIFGWVSRDICDTELDETNKAANLPASCQKGPQGDFQANGSLDVHEPPIGGVVVRLGVGACPSVGLAEITTIATDISYTFLELDAGTYCVSIDSSEEPNASLLQPGTWSYPERKEGIVGRTVTLEPRQTIYDINFGWEFQTNH